MSKSNFLALLLDDRWFKWIADPGVAGLHLTIAEGRELRFDGGEGIEGADRRIVQHRV